MCTLTYLLTETGYELFFNRDEQRARQPAILPHLNKQIDAIYPIDPVGQGTWLAVHKSGLSLALLNFYQAEQVSVERKFVSRGLIILALLKEQNNVIASLKKMDLTQYSAFQLCVFEKDLSKLKNRVRTFTWDGNVLAEYQCGLPITSSSVDFDNVYQHRSERFLKTVDIQEPTRKDLFTYHRSQESLGKLSVKMSRSDALTVSFSHITVEDKISFTYFDYLQNTQQQVITERLL